MIGTFAKVLLTCLEVEATVYL